MHVEDFDERAAHLLRALTAHGVQHVVLEDDDDVALTIVPGPSRRNLERLARVLKHEHAALAAPGPRLRYGELVRGDPGRWPLRVGGVAVDVLVVGVDDGRWTTYFDEARAVDAGPGLAVLAVRDQPILRLRRVDAREAMPELQLTQRERDHARLRRRRELLRDERRAARRERLRRLAGRR